MSISSSCCAEFSGGLTDPDCECWRQAFILRSLTLTLNPNPAAILHVLNKDSSCGTVVLAACVSHFSTCLFLYKLLKIHPFLQGLHCDLPPTDAQYVIRNVITAGAMNGTRKTP